MIIQLLTGSDRFISLIRIRNCKLSTTVHTEKRLVTSARVLYFEAIKIKGDIAAAIPEKNLDVVDNVLRQLETGGLIRLNALKLIAKFICGTNGFSSRFGLLVFRGRDNGFVIRSRCTLVLQLVLGLSLKLSIVARLVALGLVTILVFGIPVVGVAYISRLT